MQQFRRQDQLAIVARMCNDNQISPESTNYAAFIKKVAVTYLCLPQVKAKELTGSLTIMWKANRWSNLLNSNSDEDEEEQEETSEYEINRINLPQEQFKLRHVQVQEALATITTTEPVKTMETPKATQPDKLTDKQVAKILYTQARRDTFNGVGRLILSEARDIADNKHLTIHDVADLWRTHYPIIEAETRSNILLIYWDGKDSRPVFAPVIPKPTPVFNPKKQPAGDIIEDDNGVVPEEEQQLG